MTTKYLLPLAALAAVAVGCESTNTVVASPETQIESEAFSGWRTFLTADDVAAMLESGDDVVLVDARKPEEYVSSHLPGAINLPGAALRTSKAKPGQGESQYLFRTADGSLDVARYERLLGEVGIDEDDTVIVYGNHAGKTDGSIPAMILDILGHEEVYFLDGTGPSEWAATGRELVSGGETREPTEYEANPDADAIWDLDDVLAHVGDESVVFLDTRSPEEFAGDPATLEKRGNARGGHIPGAVLINYTDHLDGDKRTLAPAEIAKQFADAGVEKDETVVLYCQTATRVSLPYLALKDLGYENVKVYDASWHEYGNRDDTPIEQ